MTAGREASADREHFRMGGVRRVLVVPLILLLLGGAGLAVGAALRTPAEVKPYEPDAGSRIRPFLVSRSLARGGAQAAPSPIGGGGSPQADVVRIGEEGAVSVPVPAPWKVLSPASASKVLLASGTGAWFAATASRVDPSLPATDLLARAVLAELGPDRYALVRATGARSLTPFGSLVSWAVIGYSAVRVDVQGARTIGGNLFALVRDDGVSLVVAVEVGPADRWPERVNVWQPLFEGAAESLAGASLP